MPLSPTFLIYRSGFAPTNGTSVQLQRLLSGFEEAIVHLMWDDQEAGDQSVEWVINTDDGFRWKRPFARLGQVLKWAWGLVAPYWWRSGRLNTARLGQALSQIPLRPEQAYIIFYNESDASKACALWEAVGRPPFVLHIMDIFDPDQSEAKTPNSVRLIRSADHVVCLTQLIEDKMKRLGAVATSRLPLCSDLEPSPRPIPAGPLKVVISGALYAGVKAENRAMDLLVAVWPKLLQAFPGIELHYAGASGSDLPLELLSNVIDHGLLPPTQGYQRLLRSCHLAYVPVSHLDQTSLRFSLPSRIPDYLISGLPVIACTGENTGIHEFFQLTPPECTRLVRTPDEFLSAVQNLAGDSDRWRKASDAAVTYSKNNFAIESTRQLLFDQLNLTAVKNENDPAGGIRKNG